MYCCPSRSQHQHQHWTADFSTKNWLAVTFITPYTLFHRNDYIVSRNSLLIFNILLVEIFLISTAWEKIKVKMSVQQKVSFRSTLKMCGIRATEIIVIKVENHATNRTQHEKMSVRGECTFLNKTWFLLILRVILL